MNLPKPFNPPQGFNLARPSISSSSIVPRLLAEENLEHKQLWHIIAPASLSFSDIEKVQVKDSYGGTWAASNQGVECSLVKPSELQAESYCILAPSPLENSYMPILYPISRILNLQQVARPLTAEDVPNSPRRSSNSHLRTQTQTQPLKGLIMQDKSFGALDVKTKLVVEKTLPARNDIMDPKEKFRTPPGRTNVKPEVKTNGEWNHKIMKGKKQDGSLEPKGQDTHLEAMKRKKEKREGGKREKIKRT